MGYSVDGERKQSITYSPATGRIAESDGFYWEYLTGTDLKSKLTYPNNAVVTWTYEPHRDLLTAVTNATYSTYVYTNDLLGRRTSKKGEQYGYNVRDELIAADDVSYNYDDIGNRTTAEGKTYTANNLNQYTAIDDFAPQYDADGNQTLIKTETGVWSVTYNAENRPIRWESGDTVITMAFDRMGRRVEMRTVKDGEETLQRFVYDNYLCVQQLRGADNAATRPLIFLPASSSLAYYFHDGNKNVSDLVDIHGSVVHYDYTPFGTLVISTSTENPFRFSSELYDDILGLVYYNYRHYNPKNGRWCGRDPISDYTNGGEYLFSSNSVDYIDFLGLEKCHVVRNQLNLALPSNSLKVSGFIRYDEETCEGCCNNVLLDKYKITKRISGGITIKGKAPVPYLSFGSTGTGLFVTGSGTLLANASYSRNLCDNQVTVSGGGSLVFYGGLKLALVDFSALEISVTGELGVSASLTVVCNDDSCALQGRACFNARLLGTVKIWKFTRNNIQQSKFCTEPLTFL